MRHRNFAWRNPNRYYFYHKLGEPITRPYLDGNYTWTKPNKDRRYVQILQYVYDHPNCKRSDIHEAVFHCHFSTGSNSSLYACMLADDLIDYNKKYQYTITKTGMKILKQAYVNDCAKAIGC